MVIGELPEPMRPIVRMFAKFLTKQTDDPKYGYIRRFLAIASNSAFSLPHLEAIRFSYEGGQICFESKFFSSTEIDFESVHQLPVQDALKELEITQLCFEKVLLQTSNEYTLNGFIWFPILTAAFMKHVYAHQNL